MSGKYRKLGDTVYGLPFNNGWFGIKVVKKHIRTYDMEPVLRYRKLTPKERFEIAK